MSDTRKPETGPLYGQPIPAGSLPIGGALTQAMASARDLEYVHTSKVPGAHRVASAYEVLAMHYEQAVAELNAAKLEIKGMRDNNTKLTLALAETVGIEIRCDPSMHGMVWEVFCAGVEKMKQERDAMRDAASMALADLTTSKCGGVDSMALVDSAIERLEQITKKGG